MRAPLYKTSKKYFFVPINTQLFINGVLLEENKVFNLTVFDKYPNITVCSLDTSFAFCVKGVNQITCYLNNHVFLVIFPEFSGYFGQFNAFFSLFFRRLQFGFKAAALGFLGVFRIFNFRYRQKWIRQCRVLRYTIGHGFQHKLFCFTPEDFGVAVYKETPHKKNYLFFSHQFRELKELIYLIHDARPATIYKAKGISLFEEPLRFKEGKKARW
jgi:hypothetical protein